eukprot:CAMPEP_0197566994 /NCGR_PEP_ID=MMETSP1320-20131121/34860_1 /TAXON_ID=91990 /ORGANISM="Bolidomonas sp., Strain RCC2347" /LENGTH=40 /DNA_ID= /DNA_START= /DNA_END= /DNA_ORIENTATION=
MANALKGHVSPSHKGGEDQLVVPASHKSAGYGSSSAAVLG